MARRVYTPERPPAPKSYRLCPKMLRAGMRAHGYTQIKLAEALGIRQSSVHHLLSKPCDTGLDNLLKLADLFEIDPEDLIVEVDGEPADLPVSRAMRIARTAGVSLRDLEAK